MTDHINLGLRRVGHQYANSPKFRAFLMALLQPLNNIEAVAQQLMQFDIDAATGEQLRFIGRLAGAPEVVPRAYALPFFGFADQYGTNNWRDNSSDASNGNAVMREWDEVGFTDHVLSETEYRQLIKAKIKYNQSEASPDAIIDLINDVTSISFTYSEAEQSIRINAQAEVSLYERRLIRMFVPRPAGTELRIIDGTRYTQTDENWS